MREYEEDFRGGLAKLELKDLEPPDLAYELLAPKLETVICIWTFGKNIITAERKKLIIRSYFVTYLWWIEKTQEVLVVIACHCSYFLMKSTFRLFERRNTKKGEIISIPSKSYDSDRHLASISFLAWKYFQKHIPKERVFLGGYNVTVRWGESNSQWF